MNPLLEELMRAGWDFVDLHLSWFNFDMIDYDWPPAPLIERMDDDDD